MDCSLSSWVDSADAGRYEEASFFSALLRALQLAGQRAQGRDDHEPEDDDDPLGSPAADECDEPVYAPRLARPALVW